MPETPILAVQQVSKVFGGLRAVDDLDLELREGEIFGLIGPNGAGKTTLFNVIAGLYSPTRGRILFDGKDITALRPYERCRLGIARTFQITKPFLNLSVLDNVTVGAYFGVARRIPENQARDRAAEILDWLGLGGVKDAPASQLTLGQRKKLELCRALATQPRVLLLDEVVAGLNPTEVADMVDIIRKINASGVTILMIEHVLKAVMALSQRIMVMHFGQRLAEGTPQEIVHNEEVIRAYLGGMVASAQG